MEHFKRVDEIKSLDGFNDGDDFLQNNNYKFPKSFIDESSFDLSEEIGVGHSSKTHLSDVSLQYESIA